uniref:Tetratricopeptide repeat and ankyrin repeat containing 1 n=1 Tax=Latimeria chalumnae TaxID=7897 RepID=H3AAJ0_LATCH
RWASKFLRIHSREISLLFCNRANALYKLKRWEEACVSARNGISADPTFVKGYYWAGCAMMQLNGKFDALYMFKRGLDILKDSTEKSLIADLIIGILTIGSGKKVVLKQFLMVLEEVFQSIYSPGIWQLVIERLAKKGLWQSFQFLLIASRQNKLPKNINASQISLKDIFEKYISFAQYYWISDLVMWLITKGASVESIGAYPLHTIMKLSTKNGDRRLLQWLMSYKPQLKDFINQQDEDGCTLLHIVASSPTKSHLSEYTLKRQTDDVRLLLQLGADPNIPDNHQRIPADYLKRSKNFKAVNLIKDHLAKTVPPAASKETSGSYSLFDGVQNQENTEMYRKAAERFARFCVPRNAKYLPNLLPQQEVRLFLQQVTAVNKVPLDVVCNIDVHFASGLLRQLLERRRWQEVLLLLTGRADGVREEECRIFPACDLSDLNLCRVIYNISKHNALRIALIECLIENGVSPNGVAGFYETPLQTCLKEEDFEVAYFLLTRGANPQSFSVVQGDTPLHAAVYVLLDKKDETGFCILKYLLENCKLDLNAQDDHGNTVMHIVFQKQITRHQEKIMDLLSKYDVNLKIKNKEGKDVKHKIKMNDPRLVMWNKFVGKNKKKREQDVQNQKPRTKAAKCANNSKPSQQKRTDSALPDDSTDPDGSHQQDPAPSNWEQLESEASRPLTAKDSLMQAIEKLINQLEWSEMLTEDSTLIPNSSKAIADTEANASSSASNGCSSNGNVEEIGGGVMHCIPENPVVEEDGGLDFSDLEDVDYLQELDFDNMTWEIECTSEVLKRLGCKTMPQYMKKKIVLVIQKLGNGEWTPSCQKRLKHLKSDIQLFEAKLDKGARMLWELAIDFSPRCSENPEKIIEAEHSLSRSEETTGRIYSQMIRIWDIVLDHNKLNHVIDTICSAYNRGMSCILRKKLKGISKAQLSSTENMQKRIPLCFVEYQDFQEKREDVLREYFPPASAVETEYNIMKFHSFSTNMAHNILSNMDTKIEYPFRVGELEYAVIDLDPKPLEAIILIGRSGTGKTTCCLYRLWKKFQSYWEAAKLAGGPLLVRPVWQKLSENANDSDSIEDEDSTESGVEMEMSGSTNEDETESENEICSIGVACQDLALEDEDYEEAKENDAEDEPDRLEHLHQIFVTKNHVLCQEVQRNFVELCHSTRATNQFKPLEPNIYRLQDIKEDSFPLFVTSKQLLLLLDASMPNPFFLRNEDGSLARVIAGWSTQEELVIPGLQEDDYEGGDGGEYDDDEEERVGESHAKESDPRIFVTYDVFAHEMWPKMVKGKHLCNPSLVWKEIKSFLKGSVEALSCPEGKLTEEEYMKLGRKRAPDFCEDRSEIYRLFCIYQQIKSQRGFFDEEDVLYNLSQRLAQLKELPWSIHDLYGDEIQDFTQAELALLMRCINDPNSMFLTGDTAQSIMKGVAFRFSDLRSLFHYASKSKASKKCCVVRKPRRIYQLYQNYRSHSGILQLASGIVDLLQFYFPESFDRLPRDRGLFDGPRPTILESCSVSDLAILLRGNKRKSQPIEFGAHQVILVTNEMAKENIPEELSLALVLTIYEAKGLEFDDVLLYNFFTDSEAPKEWRVISSFNSLSCPKEQSKPLVEVALEETNSSLSRPLEFNAELHKMLNGELKQLYTAITRARVNLWIFDENAEKRGPAFEYFIKRGFVQVVKTDEDTELDDSMFVKTSTRQEWVERGDYFAKHQCWKVAAKCYQKGEASEKEKLAQAHDTVLNVQSKKRSTNEVQMEYLQLAKTYLECKVPKLSMKCLRNAKEFRLCAELCKKLGKVKEAGIFYKKVQCYKLAAKCFEQAQEFKLALKMYCREELFDEAALAVQRYEQALKKKGHLSIKLPYTSEEFRLEAAAKHLRENKPAEMMKSLSGLNPEDQLFFLKSHKCLSEAAELLKRQGQEEEAAILMREHGKLMEAANLTNREDFRVECLLAVARQRLTSVQPGTDSLEREDIEAILEEAFVACEKTNHVFAIAEVSLLRGILRRDSEMLKDTCWEFVKLSHSAGAVEALSELLVLKYEAEKLLSVSVKTLEMLLYLIRALQNPQNNVERDMVKACFEFYGVLQLDNNLCQIPQNEAGRILQFLLVCDPNLNEKKVNESNCYRMDSNALTKVLKWHLLKRLCLVAQELLEQTYPDVCQKFICGLQCKRENCPDFHRPLLRHEAKSVFYCKMYLVALSGVLQQARELYTMQAFPEIKEIEGIVTDDRYVKSLLSAFYPKHFHQRVVSDNTGACMAVLGIKINVNSYRTALKMHVRNKFKSESARTRRESTDLWLEAMQVFTLSSDYPEELVSLLSKEEAEYGLELNSLETKPGNKGRGGKSKGAEGKYGMLATDTKEKEVHLCFFRLLENSVQQLYRYKDPEKCIHLFYRFMNVLAKKCVEPLIPGIGNTVMLLEFQFVLCCTVLMRLNLGLIVCLPKSYIALLHHWEFMFTKKDRYKKFTGTLTFSMVHEYKPKDVQKAVRNMKHHISYLVGVLCGREYKDFNVLLDAFGDVDYIMSGEAERTVVLCLVMLVNIGKAVDSKNENLLRFQFPEVEEKLRQVKEDYPSKVPERLIKIVQRVNAAQGMNDVVEVLQELLIERDDERLTDCFWKWDSFPGAIKGIYFQKVNPARFGYTLQSVAYVPSKEENVHEADHFVEDDALKTIASKLHQNTCTRLKLWGVIHLIYICQNWPKKLREVGTAASQLVESVPSIFIKADIDRTQCNLCGVKFTTGPYYNTEQDEDVNLDPTNSNNDEWEQTENSEDYEALTANECCETHVTLEEHRHKLAAYEEYLAYFTWIVNPLISKVRQVQQGLEKTAADHLTSKEHSKLVQGKLTNSINAIRASVEKIYRTKDWLSGKNFLDTFFPVMFIDLLVMLMFLMKNRV